MSEEKSAVTNGEERSNNDENHSEVAIKIESSPRFDSLNPEASYFQPQGRSQPYQSQLDSQRPDWRQGPYKSYPSPPQQLEMDSMLKQACQQPDLPWDGAGPVSANLPPSSQQQIVQDYPHRAEQQPACDDSLWDRAELLSGIKISMRKNIKVTSAGFVGDDPDFIILAKHQGDKEVNCTFSMKRQILKGRTRVWETRSARPRRVELKKTMSGVVRSWHCNLLDLANGEDGANFYNLAQRIPEDTHRM